MKPIRHLTILLILVISQNGYCDIIPNNSHFVDKCVKITNVGEYDNFVMLGYIWYVGNYHQDTYEVSSDECLTKGYKYNTLRLFGLKSDYISGKDIDNIDLPSDVNALETNIEINPYAGYYHDSIPIDKIEEYYKILGFTDTSVVIFKWKEVYGFNNGLADSIVTSDFNGDNSQFYQNMPTGLNGSKELILNTQVYPNPADELISVKISNSYIGLVKLQLISQDGKIQTDKEVVKDFDLLTEEISTCKLTQGIYFLKLQFGDVVETKKIVIK